MPQIVTRSSPVRQPATLRPFARLPPTPQPPAAGPAPNPRGGQRHRTARTTLTTPPWPAPQLADADCGGLPLPIHSFCGPVRSARLKPMSDQTTLARQIADLQRRATDLHSNVALASRAFVVELAGTPKSGKSTSVEAIRHFFKRHGFRVHVLTERADQCPIPMKGHLFFNTWCATSTLAELLATVDTPTDLIIVDRGLFDALIWFQTQAKRGELSECELLHIENFLLMDRWKDLFDLVVVLRASAPIALKREHAQRITERPGSIMNSPMLEKLCDAVDDATDHYGKRFKKILVQHTDQGDVRSVNADLVGQILSSFSSFVNPEILVVPRPELQGLLSRSPSAFTPTREARQILDLIDAKGQYLRRTEAEDDPSVIQIVPCGVLSYGERVLLFQRHDRSPKYRLYGKSTIWQGCHVERPLDERTPQEAALAALEARVSRRLFITRQLKSRPVGYTWDSLNQGDERH